MTRSWKLWSGLAAIGGSVLVGCSSGSSVPSSMGKSPSEVKPTGSVTSSAPSGAATAESSGVTSNAAPVTEPTAGATASTPPADEPVASTKRPVTPPPPDAVPPSAEGNASYVVKIAAKQGDTFKYRTQAKMTMDLGSLASMMGEKGNKPIEFTATTDMERKFTKIGPAGFSVEETLLDVKTSDAGKTGLMGMMGQGMKQAKGTKATTEYDMSGRIKGNGAKGTPMGGDMASLSSMIGFQGLILPNRAIKVGDAWTEKLDIQKMMSAMSPGQARFKMDAIPVNIKFLRVEGAGADKIGVFSVTIDAKPNMQASAEKTQMNMNFAMESESLIKLDMVTGLIRESNGTFKNIITMPNLANPRSATKNTISQTAVVSIRRI